jgi:5'-3' exonuclease
MTRTLLIDGDTLIFSAAARAETVIQWDHSLFTLHSELDEAIGHFEEQLEEIKTALQSTEVIIALSDPDTSNRWRSRVMPSYKQNRKGTRKPIVFKPLLEYVQETQRTYLKPTLEGDDVLGILATHPKLVPGEKVVVAIDKDLLTIPGANYNYMRREERFVTEAEADHFLYMQCLMGDATDGYPGCPGVGPQRAEKLLTDGLVLEPRDHTITRGPRKGTVETRWETGETTGTPWEVIVSAYRAAGLGEEVALQNARVARILRHTDYDFKNKKVILWNP